MQQFFHGVEIGMRYSITMQPLDLAYCQGLDLDKLFVGSQWQLSLPMAHRPGIFVPNKNCHEWTWLHIKPIV